MDEERSDNLYELVEGLLVVGPAVEEYIRKKGIPTGSRVFGGFESGKSDVDIIVLPERFLPFDISDLIDHGYGTLGPGSKGRDDSDDDFKSIYIKMRFTRYPVNLLVMKYSSEYKVWVEATRLVKQLKFLPEWKGLVKIKRHRVELFESVKSMIRYERGQGRRRHE